MYSHTKRLVRNRALVILYVAKCVFSVLKCFFLNSYTLLAVGHLILELRFLHTEEPLHSNGNNAVDAA